MFSTLLLLLAYPSLEEPQLRLVGAAKRPASVFFANALVAALLFGAFVIGVFEAIHLWAPEWLSSRDRATGEMIPADFARLRVLVLLTPVVLVQRLVNGLLQGLRDMKAFNLVFMSQSVSLLFAVLGLVVWGGFGIGGAVASHAISWCVAASLAVWFCLRRPEIRGGPFRCDFSLLRRLVRDGIRLHGGVIAAFIILQSDQLVLNRHHGAAAVGLYTVGVALSGHLRRLIVQPVKEVVGSRLPKLMNDPPALSDAIAKSCRHTLLLVLAPALGLACFGWLAIWILYGEAFLPAYQPLLILLPGSLFWSVAVILSYWLIGSNRYGHLTLVGILVATLNLVLNLIFVPAFGMAAAAATSTLSYGVHLAIFAVMVSRGSGLPMRSFLVPERSDLGVYKDAWGKLRAKLGRRSGGSK